MNHRTLLAIVALMTFAGCLFAGDKKPSTAEKGGEKKDDPALHAITDDPKLPRVLIIGDSISIGYTVPVRNLLHGKANLHRPADNCGPTTRGLEKLDAWLGDGHWDVIHFNFGLHDLKYVDDKNKNTSVAAGHPQVPLDQYEANLRKIVERLKKTGAKLIWCTTTPVPDGTRERVKGDETKYNEVAAKVMKEAGIVSDDLCAFIQPNLARYQNKANVHYTKEGYEQLAGHVSSTIEKALAK